MRKTADFKPIAEQLKEEEKDPKKRTQAAIDYLREVLGDIAVEAVDQAFDLTSQQRESLRDKFVSVISEDVI